jgi:AbrB family looped-hinge helix DNA binding protein
MKVKEAANIVIRPKRQITLPREFCKKLDINPGDRLEMTVEGNRLIATPMKSLAVNAVREIRETFGRLGITENELQDTGRKVRKESGRKRYAGKD